MANEISVTTSYTFLSSAGTLYSENHVYFSDAATTASRPRLMGFNARTDDPTILEFGTAPTNSGQLKGPCLLMLVNRDGRASMIIKMVGFGGAVEYRSIKPGEWIFLDITDIDNSVYASPISYASESLSTVQALSQNSDAPGEYLCIYKAAS